MPLKSNVSLCIMKVLCNRSQDCAYFVSKTGGLSGWCNYGPSSIWKSPTRNNAAQLIHRVLPPRCESGTQPAMTSSMVDDGAASGSVCPMGCGDLQSLSLSMSPGSQSSYVTVAFK
ncbi:hypothetical protein F3Y22_tig00111662pilonHSYRG00012 [Hibiscus syriacus]|uniref:Uncharacterized protein n=1 Tax=Hibiscus syriacus TaxID=106335 RepID=A0A6A2YIQ4_HIBSY|nr:hypothetical protein F3Y22_tig00111662pilonHSYRG00012 [Hibiscus syriacus]